MKLPVNKKYFTISLYVCVCAAVILLLYFLGDNFNSISAGFSKFNRIMAPVYYGLIFAYIANPLLKFIEKHIFKFKKKERKLLQRALSLLLTYIIILSIISAFFMLLLPQVIASYNDLYAKLGVLTNDFITNIENSLSLPDSIKTTFPELYTVYSKLEGVIDFSKITEFVESTIEQVYSVMQGIVPSLLNYISAFFIGFKNVIIGTIFSIYFLASKEKLSAQLRKVFRSLLGEKAYYTFFEFLSDTDKKFGSFIVGKIIDSLIIGFITLVFLGIIGMPYYPLISVIICITNLIPFIGPFIGAIPCAFIVLTVSPLYCLIFVIFIIVLQQIDGNYIGPKILGEAIGISSLWILFAITVMGGYFGLFGMLIGAPLFAVIYSLVKKFVEGRLAARSLPTDTVAYLSGGLGVTEAKASDNDEDRTEDAKIEQNNN